MPEGELQKIPTIVWLLQSGGFWLLVWGFIIALFGIKPLIRPNVAGTAIVGFLSLLPAIFGLVAVYSAAAEYAEMAASPMPPKPVEFAAITGRAMSYSFCALLGTLLGVSVAVAAMWRSGKRVNDSDTMPHRNSIPQ